MNNYLWDTYSIVALFEGSPAYKDLRMAHIITTPFAIMEACYILQKNLGWSLQQCADLAETMMESAPSLDGRLLAAAATWRLQRSTRRMQYSYADSFGYMLSQRLGIVFLTGDRSFEGLPGVEIRRERK
jgi:hypothetical protein